MTFKDQFKFVRQNLKKNKSRLFMTVLATAIGVAFLIVLASVGFGLHKSIISDMMQNQLVTQVEIYGKEDSQGLTNEDITYFEEMDGVEAVTRRNELAQMPFFQLDDYTSNTNAIVTHFPSEIKADFKLASGRLPEGENEVVVGYHFTESLIKNGANPEKLYDDEGNINEDYVYTDDLLNKEMDMEVIKLTDGKETKKTISVKIVGIAEKPARDWAYEAHVFISEEILQEVEQFTGVMRGATEMYEGGELDAKQSEDVYDYVKVYANNVQEVEGINKTLEDKGYMIYSIANEMKQMNVIFLIMKIGLIFIGTIALIIAFIGIYNTMTMAVTERAPDIGIMKAIGAHPRTIKNIFLLESTYIGLLGAIFGTIVAYGVSFLVNLSVPFIIQTAFDEAAPEGLLLSYIPWSLTLISVGICLLVTVFSGLRPAKRATKVDVLKAMRREL